LAALDNRIAIIFNPDTEANLLTFTGHNNTLYKVVRVNDNQMLTVSSDLKAKLWNLNDASLVCDFNFVRPVTAAVYWPDGTIIIGSCNGSLSVYDPNTCTLLRSWRAHITPNCVWDMKYHPGVGVKGALVSTADLWTRIIDPEAMLELQRFPSNPDTVNALLVLKNGKIVTGSSRLDMWVQNSSTTFDSDLPEGIFVNNTGKNALISCMTVMLDARTIALGLSDGRIRFFDYISKVMTTTMIKAHFMILTGLDVISLPNNNVLLMSSAADGFANVYEVALGNALVKRLFLASGIKNAIFLKSKIMFSL
jgi:WD40 repeat protein